MIALANFSGVGPLLVIGSFIAAASGHGMTDGMDASMDGAMDMAGGSMTAFLHFAPGDILWFQGWVPQSAGAMVGACIGLVILALFDRWVAVNRALHTRYWQNRAQDTLAKRSDAPLTLLQVLLMQSPVPFIPAQDVTRGVFQVVQSSLRFAFMLAIMTFQVAFILSISIGLGLGEILYGRIIDS